MKNFGRENQQKTRRKQPRSTFQSSSSTEYIFGVEQRSHMVMAELPIKIIEHCQISLPRNSVPTPSSIPLTFLDIPWMVANTVQRVAFYEFPEPNPDFVKTILPALKSSLSIALEKFYPLASKIAVPPLPGKPQIVYNEGGSIPFIVAESMADFHDLIKNDPQEVKLIHPLVPQIPPPCRISEDGTYTFAPLLAIQVTLFPNSGMCLGARFNHAICDGMGFQHFMKSWSSICRTEDLQNAPLPVLDRRILEDPNDITTTFLNAWWDTASLRSCVSAPRSVTDQRAAFALSKATLDQLKSWISNRSNALGMEPMNISSFAAGCAFVWVCMAKTTTIEGQNDDDRNKRPQLCHFNFGADCRSRLEPPLPETYFGNCVVPCFMVMEKNVLLGHDGIVMAARAIAQKVKELNNGGALKGVETSLTYCADVANRFGVPLNVSWSPRIADSDADFGWGRPKKSVVVHIDMRRSFSLTEGRAEDGGMEVGVVLPKPSMDAFSTFLKQLDSLII